MGIDETSGVAEWGDNVPVERLRERALAMGLAGAETMSRDELLAALAAEKPSQRQVTESPEQQRAPRSEDS